MTEIEISRAVDTGNLAEVNRLLAAGADPNGGFVLFPNAQLFDSLLHIAARQRNLEIINSLLQAGADPNAQSRLIRATPLMRALGPNLGPRLIYRYDIVERLLEAGADPNIIDGHGKSALEYAANNEFYEAVEKLLPITNNTNLKKVYDMARNGGHFFPKTNRIIIDYFNQAKNRRQFEIVTRTAPGSGPITPAQAEALGRAGTHELGMLKQIANFLGPKRNNTRGGRRRRKTRVVKRGRTHKRRV